MIQFERIARHAFNNFALDFDFDRLLRGFYDLHWAPSVGQSGGVAAIATDPAGNTYVTGSNVLDTYVTGINAFVTKLDPAGNIVFTVSIGPAGSYANAIAVDPTGNVWVGGQNLSLPLVNPLQSTLVGNGVGSLVKIAPDGTVFYSSYFGGTLGSSGVNGVATDQSGNVYVTGFTEASDFPTTPGLPASPVTGGSAPVSGLFATKLNSTGQKILYSTVIAGPASCAFCFPVSITMGIGIAIDGAGNALVAGDTSTSDLPVTTTGGSGPGFVFKINAAGNELVYFTYLGSGASVGSSNSPDTAQARPIAAYPSGNAYVAGNTDAQGFVTKLSPAGTTVWSTPLSVFNPSTANAISLDRSDNLWLTGGNSVAELSADGSAVLYSEPFPAGAAGQDIAVDQSGVVHFAGSLGLISTISPPLFSTPRALSIVNAASGQHTGTVSPGEIISIFGLGLGPTTPVTATPANGLFPTSLGGVQVLVNGTPIPLLYVSASQINAEIPLGIASGALPT
jgi:streptogramin lyase